MDTKKKSSRSRQSPSIRAGASKPSRRLSKKTERSRRDSGSPPRKGYWEWDGQGVDGNSSYQYWHRDAKDDARSRTPSERTRHSLYVKHRRGTDWGAEADQYEPHSDPRISRPSDNSPLPSGLLSYDGVEYDEHDEAYLMRSPSPSYRPGSRSTYRPASSLGSRPGSRQSVHRDSHPSSRPNSPPAWVEDEPESSCRPVSRSDWPVSPVACVLVCKSKPDEYTRHSLHFKASTETESPLESFLAPDDQQNWQEDEADLERRANQFLREMRRACARADELEASPLSAMTPTPEKSPPPPPPPRAELPRLPAEWEEPQCDLRGKLTAKRRLKVVGDDVEDFTSDWSDALSDSRLDAVSAAIQTCREETEALNEECGGYDCTAAFEVPSSDLRWSLSAKKEMTEEDTTEDLRASLLAKRRRKPDDQGAKRLKTEEEAVVPPSCNINFAFFPKRMRASDFWVADQPHSNADDVPDAVVQGSAVGSTIEHNTKTSTTPSSTKLSPSTKATIAATQSCSSPKASKTRSGKPLTRSCTKSSTRTSSLPCSKASTRASKPKNKKRSLQTNQDAGDVSKDSSISAETGTINDGIIVTTDVPTCSTNAPTKPKKASTRSENADGLTEKGSSKALTECPVQDTTQEAGDDVVTTDVSTSCLTDAPTDNFTDSTAHQPQNKRPVTPDKLQDKIELEGTPVDLTDTSSDPVHGIEVDTYESEQMKVLKPENVEPVTSEKPRIKKIRKFRKRPKKQQFI